MVWKWSSINRKKAGFLFIGFGTLNLLYFLALLLRGITFAVFFGALGAVFILAGVIKIKYKKEFLMRRFGRLIKVTRIFIAVLLILFISVEALIIGGGMEKYKGKVDYIVILGAGLWGETPSQVLWQRLETSLTYIKENPDIKIVVSGGQGPGETIAEAEAMRRFLVEKGVDEKRILMENKSTTTMENLKYTKALVSSIDKSEPLKILVVTSDFHMLRAKMLARRNGFIAYGYSAPLVVWLIPTYYVRESLAIAKSFFVDKP